MSYNSGVIRLVISNQPRATHSGDLRLLTRLLPELYDRKLYYHYSEYLYRVATSVIKAVISVGLMSVTVDELEVKTGEMAVHVVLIIVSPYKNHTNCVNCM